MSDFTSNPSISEVNVIELIDFHASAKIKYLEGEINQLAKNMVKLVQEKVQLECHEVIVKALKGDI